METLCSLAIVWANLAYLLVTFPLLIRRLSDWPDRPANYKELGVNADLSQARLFSLGQWGLAINVTSVAWGVFVIVNMCWPRAVIYGTDPWGKYAGLTATGGLLCIGLLYYLLVRRWRTGILEEHAAIRRDYGEPVDRESLASSGGLTTGLITGD
jgi:hypothetical protein